MAASDLARRRRAGAGGTLVVSALTLLLVAGCATTPKAADRQPLPPRAVAPPPPEVPPSEPPVATPLKPATVVVLDPGADAQKEKPPETLAEAAARERERRRTAAPPVAVINDKNLSRFAAGQKLTEASPATPAAGTAASEAQEQTAGGHDENWWRQRGLEIRRRWRDAVDAVTRLEGDVAELRTRFYATDDPYVRDSQVKPEWDRKLAELDAARRQAAAGPDEVASFLEEGRKAGALPGWLREGAELEPKPVLPTVDENEPGEPVVVGQEPPPQ
jgi:hypothetical protein